MNDTPPPSGPALRKSLGLLDGVAIAASGNYIAGAIWPPIVGLIIRDHGWRFAYGSAAADTLKRVLTPVSGVPEASLDRIVAFTEEAARDHAGVRTRDHETVREP